MEQKTDSRAGSVDALVNGAASLGVQIDSATSALLLRLLHTILHVNLRVNLTSVTSGDEAVERHLLDSASLLRNMPLDRPLRLLDVGTGAGLPGLVLKALRPWLAVTLLDSVARKAEACREIVRTMGWSGVEIVHARAEDWAHSGARESFDLVTARAVAPLPVLLELALPFARMGGNVVAWKGPALDRAAEPRPSNGIVPAMEDELARGARAAKVLGGVVAKVDAFALPWSGAQRRLVMVRKVMETPAEYPRRAGLPGKRPLA